MSHKLSTARTSQKGVKTAARLHVASKPKSASQKSGFVAPKLAQAKASPSGAAAAKAPSFALSDQPAGSRLERFSAVTAPSVPAEQKNTLDGRSGGRNRHAKYPSFCRQR